MSKTRKIPLKSKKRQKNIANREKTIDKRCNKVYNYKLLNHGFMCPFQQKKYST